MRGKDKRKHRRRRKEKKIAKEKPVSVPDDAVDKVIDCDFEEFKEGIIREKIPIGQLIGLRTILNNSYSFLVQIKNELMDRILEHPEEEEECKYNIQRCYIVLEKIEQKIVWLKEREKELLKSTDISSD